MIDHEIIGEDVRTPLSFRPQGEISMVMAKEEISPVGRDDIDVVAVDLLVAYTTETAQQNHGV